MKGEIYDLHYKQLSVVREIQSMNSHFVLGGALGLKVQGYEIPHKWYNIYLYTNYYYKIKEEECHHTDASVRISELDNVLVAQTISRKALETCRIVNYRGNTYKVAQVNTIMHKYMDWVLRRGAGREEIHTAFTGIPLIDFENKYMARW